MQRTHCKHMRFNGRRFVDFESHFKTKADAFGSHALNSSDCRSIPKRIEIVEGPRVITRVKMDTQPQTNGFCFTFLLNYHCQLTAKKTSFW